MESNNQLHKAVVLGDVSLQNVLAGAENTFKSGSVELDTLECALGLHGGCTWTFKEQGNLPWD